MENNPSNQEESLWRRKQSDAGRQPLPPAPGAELESRLTDALAKIPNVSVPSNFTGRVMEAVDLAERQAERTRWRWNWRLLLPRLAAAAAVVVLAGVAIQSYEMHSQRAAVAKSLAQIAAADCPGVEALENLDAIQRMSQSARADGELLAALQ